MRRWRWFGARLLLALPVVLGIVVLNFFLIHLAPGDAASALAGESGAATPECMAALRERFGLDQPLGAQFLAYLGNIAHLDLGYSFRNDAGVLDLIPDRLRPTALLMVSAHAIALVLGTLLGLPAAVGRNTWRDGAVQVLTLLAYATPTFWLGPMLIVVFAIRLAWLLLDATFWDSPHTIRYAIHENGHGFAEIHAHRMAARPAGPGIKERRLRLQIPTLGRDLAMVNLEFKVRGQDWIGRQSQTWVRLPDAGWKAVSAHVPVMQAPAMPPQPG